jgi:serine/threonine protein kinase
MEMPTRQQYRKFDGAFDPCTYDLHTHTHTVEPSLIVANISFSLCDRIYEREKCDEAVVDGPELKPMNNLSPSTKLVWALQMAEGLANLHNHPRGLIIHDDVQLPQFMVASDGRLKLGDFNRAEFILYDEEHGNYCKYKNGEGPGDVSMICTVGW